MGYIANTGERMINNIIKPHACSPITFRLSKEQRKKAIKKIITIFMTYRINALNRRTP